MHIKNVLIIGADGYIGWPLFLELYDKLSKAKFTLLDNCITREKVASLGGHSLLPISSFKQRVESLNCNNVNYVNGSTLNKELVDSLIKEKFDIIFHLGHLRTAPFSMKSYENCYETVQNNELGFLNIIWSLKEYSRNTVLVKLGSFGAYAPSGVEVPEGDITLTINNVSSELVPFPKQANDFYHITKANDSLFARAACNNWGLKIVDVMQSTVFGSTTEATVKYNQHTRLDYDDVYGTVVNRFITQALLGIPLTVYGGGEHSTGIMVLADAVRVLASLVEIDIDKGQYLIINNNPQSYKIINIANMVVDEFSKIGKFVQLDKETYDPRNEKGVLSKVTSAESLYSKSFLKETPICKEIENSINQLSEHKASINKDLILPKFNWND